MALLIDEIKQVLIQSSGAPRKRSVAESSLAVEVEELRRVIKKLSGTSKRYLVRLDLDAAQIQHFLDAVDAGVRYVGGTVSFAPSRNVEVQVAPLTSGESAVDPDDNRTMMNAAVAFDRRRAAGLMPKGSAAETSKTLARIRTRAKEHPPFSKSG